MTDQWTYVALRSQLERTTPLRLSWEIHCDPISDDWSPDEIDAEGLLRLWVERYFPDETGEQLYGPGMVRIFWFVDGHPGGTIEGAPFTADVPDPDPVRHFLSYYTWPVHARTGEPVNWVTLPVQDKLWRADRADKGGFFQEATGWKPAPLQPVVHVPGLLAAVPNLSGVVPYEPRRVALKG